MKRLVLIVTIIIATLPLSAQVIKLDVGTTFSSMQDDTPMHNFSKTLVGSSVAFGVDWLEKEWFYLSSEVGYITTGGAERIEIMDSPGLPTGEADWQLMRHNIHVNTTFRAKLALNRFHVYLGVGPKVDIPVQIELTDTYNDATDSNLPFLKNEVMFGIKAEAGVAYNFNDVRVGLNFAYLPDFTRQASYLNQTTRNDIFKLSISVGYIL